MKHSLSEKLTVP